MNYYELLSDFYLESKGKVQTGLLTFEEVVEKVKKEVKGEEDNIK